MGSASNAAAWVEPLSNTPAATSSSCDCIRTMQSHQRLRRIGWRVACAPPLENSYNMLRLACVVGFTMAVKNLRATKARPRL